MVLLPCSCSFDHPRSTQRLPSPSPFSPTTPAPAPSPPSSTSASTTTCTHADLECKRGIDPLCRRSLDLPRRHDAPCRHGLDPPCRRGLDLPHRRDVPCRRGLDPPCRRGLDLPLLTRCRPPTSSSSSSFSYPLLRLSNRHLLKLLQFAALPSSSTAENTSIIEVTIKLQSTPPLPGSLLPPTLLLLQPLSTWRMANLAIAELSFPCSLAAPNCIMVVIVVF